MFRVRRAVFIERMIACFVFCRIFSMFKQIELVDSWPTDKAYPLRQKDIVNDWLWPTA
jgi:hypothetical protein